MTNTRIAKVVMTYAYFKYCILTSSSLTSLETQIKNVDVIIAVGYPHDIQTIEPSKPSFNL